MGLAGALERRNNLGANFLPDDPKADANGFVKLVPKAALWDRHEQFRPEMDLPGTSSRTARRSCAADIL